MVADIYLNEDESVYVTGAVIVEDLAGLEARHFLAMSPSIFKKLVTVGQVFINYFPFPVFLT